MKSIHDQLAAIQHHGASGFSKTSLADSHSAVTRRVRRDRTVRAGVATLAGVGVAGAGTFGVLQLRGADALVPMGSPSPTTSGTESPAPSPNVGEGGILEVAPGDTAHAVIDRLATAYRVSSGEVESYFPPRLPQAAQGEIEGWLHPGTYDTDELSLDEVTAQMVARQVIAVSDDDYSHESWHELLTIASLVEQESPLAEDMPRVARVILNRVDMDMRLELDSTVRYALGQDNDAGPFTTGDEREVDSQYNTYVHPGLPPGPIGTPSPEAIEAAANPTAGDWLYFVTVNPDTGETLFAEDFEQHQKNVLLLQEWAQANN